MGKKKPKKAAPPPPGPVRQPARPVPAANISSRHRQTLVALFADPIRTNIPWGDFVGLMSALGATIRTSGNGSAYSFVFGGRTGVFHRPHPGNQLYGSLVRRIRRFLRTTGVQP